MKLNSVTGLWMIARKFRTAGTRRDSPSMLTKKDMYRYPMRALEGENSLPTNFLNRNIYLNKSYTAIAVARANTIISWMSPGSHRLDINISAWNRVNQFKPLFMGLFKIKSLHQFTYAPLNLDRIVC